MVVKDARENSMSQGLGILYPSSSRRNMVGRILVDLCLLHRQIGLCLEALHVYRTCNCKERRFHDGIHRPLVIGADARWT